MPAHDHSAEEATPLVGKKFETQQQSMAGVVNMWSGRLIAAQRVRRELEEKLEALRERHRKLGAQYTLAISLMTDDQLANLSTMVADLERASPASPGPAPDSAGSAVGGSGQE